MHKNDLIRLRHMLNAAREALSFVKGKSRNDLDKNRMLVLSVIKDIEIIGEAAGKVSPEAQAEAPGIPWKDIIYMRNRLIHAYFDVDLDVVWDTVSNELPALNLELEKLLSAKEPT